MSFRVPRLTPLRSARVAQELVCQHWLHESKPTIAAQPAEALYQRWRVSRLLQHTLLSANQSQPPICRPRKTQSVTCAPDGNIRRRREPALFAREDRDANDLP